MQGDLFEVPSSAAIMSGTGMKETFSEKMRVTLRLDQIIVGMIALLVIYVLVFSFGVEKGKRFALAELKAERLKRQTMVQELGQKILEMKGQEMSQRQLASMAHLNSRKTASNFNVQPVNVPARATAPGITVAIAPVIPPADLSSAPAAPATLASGFTVQTVTFNSKAQAEKSIQILKDKGQEAFLIPSGRFYQVCLGKYATKRDATAKLAQLKASGVAPKDAFIRSFKA